MSDLSKTSREIILEELSQLRASILQNLARYNRNATGETARSLRIQLNPDGGTLFGRNHFYTLEVGRGPTRNITPSTPTLRERIYAWIQAKGVHVDGYTDLSLSYAIAKTIHKLGTKLFRDKKMQDIYSTALDEAIKRINYRLLEEAKVTVNNIHINLGQGAKIE